MRRRLERGQYPLYLESCGGSHRVLWADAAHDMKSRSLAPGAGMTHVARLPGKPGVQHQHAQPGRRRRGKYRSNPRDIWTYASCSHICQYCPGETMKLKFGLMVAALTVGASAFAQTKWDL